MCRYNYKSIEKVFSVGFKLLFMIIILFILLFSGGCAHCKNGEMKCSGNTVKVCDRRGKWRKVTNCKDYDMRCVIRNKKEKDEKGSEIIRKIATCGWVSN